MKLVLPKSYTFGDYAQQLLKPRLLLLTTIAVILITLIIKFLPPFLENFCVKVSFGDTVF
jgi:hypothetical protein